MGAHPLRLRLNQTYNEDLCVEITARNTSPGAFCAIMCKLARALSAPTIRVSFELSVS